MNQRNYIVIEGVIGAGKSCLAEMLSKRLDAYLVHEKHEENPFLIDFYKDPQRYAFQTELFFLLSRYRQQMEEFSQTDLFHQYIISDYHFSKNVIFASINLDERDLGLYKHVAALLEKDIAIPDMVVYLQSSPERLMRNIRLRDRPYERNMDPRYIESLVEAYNHFFFRYQNSPLLIVNATEIDFVDHPDQFEDLFQRLIEAPDGTSHYNPAGGGSK